MADPLSMAASIAGIIALADLAFRPVFSYIYKAKDARKDIQNLKEEISGLSNALRILDALANELEAEGGQRDLALNTQLFDQCRRILEEINTKVAKAVRDFEDARKWKKVSRQLKWPFSVSETKDLLDNLSRYKSTILLATSADSLGKLQTCLSQQAVQNAKIEGLVQKVYEKTEITASILLDRQKQRILNFFMKPTLNPQPNLDQSIKCRHLTTGNWLLLSPELQSWFTNKGSLLWLNGIAGGGKTVLAGLVIQEALSRNSPDIGVAFFFCDYKNTESSQPSKILGAIASQLALQSDESFQHLEDYFKELCPSRALSKEPEVAGLRDTIAKMIKAFRQVFIVVDGLDECGDGMSSVTVCLSDLATLAEPATVALFSRNEMQIRTRMRRDFTEIHIEAHTEDIENYVESELEQRIQSFKLNLRKTETRHAIRRELISRAHGMFRWVACQLDYMCEFATDHDRLQALKELPPTLHDSYRRLLQRVNTKPAKVRKMVQLCLHFIAFFPVQLTVLELCQAVSTPEEIGARLNEDNTVIEDDITLYCSSLIRKSADGTGFEFSHFTVREFLETEMQGLEQYKLSRPKSTSLLALQCLRFVQLRNINISPDNQDEFLEKQKGLVSELPFYRQAVAYWPMFTRDGFDELNEPLLVEAAGSLFYQPYAAKFRCWVYWFMVTCFETKLKEDLQHKGFELSSLDCAEVARFALRRQLEPLHLASALNMPEVCSRLIEKGANTNARCGLGTPLLLSGSSLLGLFDSLKNSEVLRADSRIFSLLLSNARRRNSTIRSLLNSGATLRDASSHPEVFSRTIMLACHLQDFNPVIGLLSNGITPTAADINSFESYLNRWWPYCENRLSFEVSFQKLNKYLQDTSAFDTEWGFRLGKVVWAKAVAMELSFTSDPNLTDSRISLSLDALRERIVLSIDNDEPEALSRYLGDGRVLASDSGPWKDCSCETLLHHATNLNACRCVDLLLDKGSDPYARNCTGKPVLHYIDIRKDGAILDVFLKHGVSLLHTDTDDVTIWHLCAVMADSSPSFMDNLFNSRPEETRTAVLMKTTSGDSPLTLALSTKPDSQVDFELLEENALSFIAYCNHVPQFWEKHGPILRYAFKFGSLKVIQRLSDLGIKPEPFIPGNLTPLHELEAEVSPNWVEYLMATFPSAVECRHSDRLPLEIYADTCVKSLAFPNEAVFKLLGPNKVLKSRDNSGSTPWEYVCHMLERCRDLENVTLWARPLSLIWNYCISLGVMNAYEDVSGQCGPSQLISSLVRLLKTTRLNAMAALLPHQRLDQLILSSKRWNPLSPDNVWSLKEAIHIQDLDTVKILLKHSLDVHQRVDGLSAIEFACDGIRATELCSTSAGRAILQLILDNSDHQKLGEFTPDNKGLGLLHRISCSRQEPHVRWLMEELVRRGVDINGINAQASEDWRGSPLHHHVTNNSNCYSGYLLEMGADPSVSPLDGGNRTTFFDAVSTAAWCGNLSFLQKLLAFSQSTDTSNFWKRALPFTFPFGKGTRRMKVSNLHIASFYGCFDIVEFLVENRLLSFDIAVDSITPLHIAALGGHPRIIEYLVGQGQAVDVLSEQRDTPLHFAALNGHLPAVKELLSRGARGSINVDSRTPKMAASEIGHQDIVELLDKEIGNHSQSRLELMRVQRHMNGVLDQLKTAIISDNFENCEIAASSLCNLNSLIPKSGGCFPLCFSLQKGRSRIARMFLDHHATTLKRCYAGSHEDRGVSILEYAALYPDLIDILGPLIDRYIEEGGDLVNGPDSPIFFAAKGNLEGLQILLKYLKKHDKLWRKRDGALNEVINRRLPSRVLGIKVDEEFTALHVAVYYNNTAIAGLLLQSGADVDAVSRLGVTPIELSASSEMTSLLVRFGASKAPLLTRSAIETLLFWSNDTKLINKVLAAADMTEYAIQMAEGSDPWIGIDFFAQHFLEFQPGLRHILALQHLRNPLMDRLGSDSMSTNYFLSCSGDNGFFLNLHLRLDNVDPFPWHRIAQDYFRNIPFLRETFRHFQRRFPQPILRRWMNLEPDRGWSPLCRAASLGFIEQMKNCLSIGADIDFEGCPWGSALIIASACGRLDSVKYLVRAGAKIDYIGRKGPVSALLVAESKAVKSWVLVGRFVEQGKIAAATECETSHTAGQTGRWSGVAKIKVRLAELYYRRYGESSLDYAKRLELLRGELRGKVPYYSDGIVYKDDEGH